MDIGTVQSVDIDQQMRTAYLDFAMSVIVARALPDARDGLKPVHRRILYAMDDMGIRANTAYKKSARIVGEVLGKYHPHGDSAVYDAMARMAQDFSMRYTLVDGQGNFGSIDGDPPAAMRYTEARLGVMAQEMLGDIDKNTVNFVDNFDGSLQEPAVLPSRLPNLLLNGSVGIAVGMATNIPPHNLRELATAINYLIDHYDTIDEVSIEDLMKLVPGPDFPTGGMIVGREGIQQAYSTGRGRLIVRGMAHVEDLKGGRSAIIITEIPYQVNKTGLIERIAELAREGRMDAISDLRDESDRRGMSIVIELKRGAQPRQVLNQLYKFTPLQTTFGIIMLALVNNEPRLLSLKRALQIYIEHRIQVITRRTQFELEKARARAHILDGLLIALNNLDEVIRTIRESKDADVAKAQLMTRFKLSELQAQAILDMQLRRLAALERQKIEDEHRQVVERIADLEDMLANPRRILAAIQTDMKEITEKYGDDRRTRITAEAHEELREEDLVQDEAVLVTLTQRGYIKRVNTTAYRAQERGGRGVTGQAVKEEDSVTHLIPARTLDTLLFFTDKGKVYSQRAFNLPAGGRADRGSSIQNFLSIADTERVTAMVAVPSFDSAAYCTMATVGGRVKRIQLSELASVRPSGLMAIGLERGDMLGWVALTSGKDEIMLVTSQGQALRFSEADIRPQGRPASGISGINLKKGDKVTSMVVVEPDADLLVVTEAGFGKRTPLGEYPAKGRNTYGVVTIDQKSLDKTGPIVSARVVNKSDEITIITSGGIAIRLRLRDMTPSGRSTRGNRMINLESGDKVASVARLSTAVIRAGGENGSNGAASEGSLVAAEEKGGE
ncbi:MAG TPA: DNA gyrase subunit A [Anaerolineaceae bacterium]